MFYTLNNFTTKLLPFYVWFFLLLCTVGCLLSVVHVLRESLKQFSWSLRLFLTLHSHFAIFLPLKQFQSSAYNNELYFFSIDKLIFELIIKERWYEAILWFLYREYFNFISFCILSVIHGFAFKFCDM